jgi:PilZ domain
MAEPIIPKTYVRPDNTAVLTCEHCGLQKVIKADFFKGYKHKLKVKCSCNKVFMVILEFRNRVRKRTYLRGTYINHSQNDRDGVLNIQDISVTGLSFTCLDVTRFKEGDRLTVEFALDDEQHTEIKKDVTVRNIRSRSVGCQFDREEDVFGSALGYYVTQRL